MKDYEQHTNTTMTHTDEQLKQTLAKMLPDLLHIYTTASVHLCYSSHRDYGSRPVLNTELLHLCWLVEETLTIEQQITYLNNLYGEPSVENNPKWRIHPDCHANWQQRTIALAQTLGVNIV